MPGSFELSGVQSKKPSAWGSLFVETFFEGLNTNRAQFHPGGTQVENKFYGGRPGQLLGGKNVELTNFLSLQRRFGLTAFSTATYPTPPLYAFAFPQLDGSIRDIIDTGSSGTLAVASAAAASGSPATTVYTGTFPLGASNAYVGMIFTISGFANAGNNGSFVVTASTTTTLTLLNPNGIAETLSASAITAGAVWWDEQNGVKFFLFAKTAGAGQTSFVAVAGILYAGDGVDTWIWNPANTGANGQVFGFGIPTPTVAPTVIITESGVASVAWTASTEFSTMGLIFDSGTGDMWQLQSVNASTANTTQFGTSGSGQPAWNQSPGGTTSDTTGGGSITWTNKGPIVPWTANSVFNNGTVGGTLAQPCVVYDPLTKAVYIQSSSAGSGTSGHTVPAFKKALGQHTNDGSCVWIWIGPGIANAGLAPWVASTTYPAIGTVTNNDAATAIVELSGLQNGLPPAPQLLYLQASGGGTSGSGYTPFGTTPVVAGNLVDDGDLIWMSLGLYTWAATTQYNAWSANNTVFSAIYDALTHAFYVCTVSGISNGSVPVFNPGYGVTTVETSGLTWTNVGDGVTWATATKWYLPVQGFFPPSGSTPYGGASIIDTNLVPDVEFVVNSGLSGTVQPTWPAVGKYTDDNGTSFTLSQVAVVGPTTTYTGTGLSTLAGQQLIITGFTNAGNNGYVVALTANSTTFTVKTTSQVNETHAAAAANGLIWFNEEPFSTQSLAFTKGYAYAYSYKSRSLTDFYTVDVPGTSLPPIPPGLSAPLPFPTGSLTGDVSSASPATTTPTGVNPGAVLTISGPISTNPAVDTIVIWRSADGGGSGEMFELTEIPNLPNGGNGQWSFRDFLPDIPSTIAGVTYPGLNILEPAPIDGVNNPAPSNFRPQEYNFDRIWGISGNEVVFSGGPDTRVGNPNTAFNAADEFTFLANPVRAVKVGSILVVFTPSAIEVIAGGPSTGSFFTYTLVRGVGMLSWNALDVFAGEIFFFGSDNVLRVLSPNLTLTNAGFPIEDELSNAAISGVQDASWNPSLVYLSVLQSGNDNMIALADGSTGWYRLNPRQQNGSVNGTEPIWSPFTAITNGCRMVTTVETSPGIKKLLVGATTGGHTISKRDTSVYTDNGTSFDANFIQGTLALARRGELAILRFLEADFSGVNYQPTVSYLINEAFNSTSVFTPFTLAPQFDPPSLYGATLSPVSYSPNRYYFAGVGSLARCIFITLKVDFGVTSNSDTIYNLTINGSVLKGQ
jgi:hypothetical protein